jgi:hypothetical protein
MACLDQTSWRDPEQGPTWNNILMIRPSAPPPPMNNARVRGGLLLFWFSILNSNTYQAISQRLGNSLNASDRLSGFTSLPLAREQWKVEATRLFETSLARTQIDARNIARGVMADYPGYVKYNSTPSEMCKNTYLFISDGWTNINKSWSLIILIPCCVIVFLASTTNTEEVVLERLLCGYAMPVSVFVIWAIIQVGTGIGWILRVHTWVLAGRFVRKVWNGLISGISGGVKWVIDTCVRFWRWIT